SPSPSNFFPSSPLCPRRFGKPSPSIMEPSLLAIAACTPSTSRPSSATRTRPGRREVSRTPSVDCVASFPERPTSPTSQTKASSPSWLPTPAPHESALPTNPQPSSSSPLCCTSNVNPPPGFRRDDGVLGGCGAPEDRV